MRVFINFKRFIDRKYNVGALPPMLYFYKRNRVRLEFSKDFVQLSFRMYLLNVTTLFDKYSINLDILLFPNSVCKLLYKFSWITTIRRFVSHFVMRTISIEIRYYRWTREICTRRPISVEVHWPLFSWLKIV